MHTIIKKHIYTLPNDECIHYGYNFMNVRLMHCNLFDNKDIHAFTFLYTIKHVRFEFDTFSLTFTINDTCME